MRNNHGITLMSVIIYIICILLIASIITAVNNFFYVAITSTVGNGEISKEYGKFNMFFLEDIKENNNIITISENKTQIEFENGNIYKLENSSIYRNDVKIANNIENISFKRENLDGIEIVKVYIELNSGKEEFAKTLEFVLGRGY
jgi:hypothetical protein